MAAVGRRKVVKGRALFGIRTLKFKIQLQRSLLHVSFLTLKAFKPVSMLLETAERPDSIIATRPKPERFSPTIYCLRIYI